MNKKNQSDAAMKASIRAYTKKLVDEQWATTWDAVNRRKIVGGQSLKDEGTK